MAATDDIQAPTRQSAPAVEAPAPPAASTPAWGEEAPSTSAASAEPPLISTSRWLRVEWRERPRGAWQQISHWLLASPATWGQRVTSPLGVLALATLLLVGFGGYGVGAWGRHVHHGRELLKRIERHGWHEHGLVECTAHPRASPTPPRPIAMSQRNTQPTRMAPNTSVSPRSR